MRKKTIMATITILLLFAITISSLNQPTLAKAQSNVNRWVDVVIVSPVDYVRYHSNSIFLQVTTTTDPNFYTGLVGKFTRITYTLDDNNTENIIYNDYEDPNSGFGYPVYYNTTIANVQWGLHTITVSVTNFGIGSGMGLPAFTITSKSTVAFIVDIFLPSPTPSITPTISPTQNSTTSPSPLPSIFPSASQTQQPTLEPTPTSDNVQPENFTPAIIIIALAALAVAISLLVYFKKRKR
jgi:hypothetical protein